MGFFADTLEMYHCISKLILLAKMAIFTIDFELSEVDVKKLYFGQQFWLTMNLSIRQVLFWVDSSAFSIPCFFRIEHADSVFRYNQAKET